MLEYDRIDILKRIYVNETNASKECKKECKILVLIMNHIFAMVVTV